MIPLAAPSALIGLVLLSPSHWLDAALVLGAIIMCAIALLVGAAPDNRQSPRPISILALGVAANVAVIHATWRFLHGHHDHIWEPTRRTATVSNAPERAGAEQS